MKLDFIQVRDQRNFFFADMQPSQELTVLCGENGQGKTNMLEAVWMLTGGKSFRGSKDVELIRRDAPFSVTEAVFSNEAITTSVVLYIGRKETQYPGRSCILNANGKRVRPAALVGRFKAVVFEPGHLSLIKGGPEGRRRFLDTALCQLYPGYLAALRRYTRILAQKNALLKQYAYTEGAQAMLDIYNRDLAKTGADITGRRMRYMQELREDAIPTYCEISLGKEMLELQYRPSFETTLEEKLEAVKPAELRAGFCLVGPHREDFEVLLNGQPARIYASQGQQRSCVLAIKLAEAEQVDLITGDHPVVLLDDVLSELDEGRQEYLLTRVEERQTFITTCDASAFKKTNGKILYVKERKIRPEP